jgi:hypothetical protein
MRRLFCCFVVVLVCTAAWGQENAPANNHKTHFYKAEHGVAADYLELAADGTYRVIDREHMFVDVTERGHWHQGGSVITFRPLTVMRGGEMVRGEGRFYQGTEVEYRGRTFISFSAEDSAGIVIPVEETKKQLDSNPQGTPDHTFFRIAAKIYARETKQAYPFRYVKPDIKR